MTIALGLALVTDGIQLIVGPVPIVAEVLDVVVMLLMTWLIGFHLLLLPTFLVEFIPVIDMLPTWTACVAAVLAIRKREQSVPSTVSAPVAPVSAPPIIPRETDLPPQITSGEPDQGTRPR